MLLEIVSMSKSPFHDLVVSSISGISCKGILMKQIKSFKFVHTSTFFIEIPTGEVENF